MANQSVQLTEEYRQQQLALRAAFLAQFIPTVQLLSWSAIDATYAAWVQVAMTLIRSYRQASADIAVDFYERLRLVEAPSARTPAPVLEFRNARVSELPGPARLSSGRNQRPGRGNAVTPGGTRNRPDSGTATGRPAGAPDAPHFGEWKPAVLDWGDADEATIRSLLVTGPSAMKRASKNGLNENQARRLVVVQASGSATRHVLNGARDATLELIKADAVAVGYIRVTAANPCAFCAMLASRGPVYHDASFAESDPRFEGPGTVKVHDNCACTVKAVFSRAAQWPGRAAEFRQMWRDNIEGQYSGRDALNAWRRLYEAAEREAQRADEISA
jgi:hypothetical protein